tara:strand:- start:50 stop:733 length:684 start_codon:yes stop_codon:yes gene_type:complete
MSNIGNVNKFRTNEILDEDNKYKRQVQEMERKQLLKWAQDPEKVSPYPDLKPNRQYGLTKLFNDFLEEVDANFEDYQKAEEEMDDADSGRLLAKWNDFINYYNIYIGKQYKPFVDNLMTENDIPAKMQTISDMAYYYEYRDSDEIGTLADYVYRQVYKPIRHIAMSRDTQASIADIEDDDTRDQIVQLYEDIAVLQNELGDVTQEDEANIDNEIRAIQNEIDRLRSQ